jgi:predicted metal-dependent hydrolase
LRLDDEAVRLAVVSRLGWIRRKQKEFAGQDRQSQREIVTGESHYFQGRRYLLDVKECDGVPEMRLVGNTTLELRVPPGHDHAQRDAVLQRWYRRQLRALLPPLLAKWEPRIGKTVAEVRIKRM